MAVKSPGSEKHPAEVIEPCTGSEAGDWRGLERLAEANPSTSAPETIDVNLMVVNVWKCGMEAGGRTGGNENEHIEEIAKRATGVGILVVFECRGMLVQRLPPVYRRRITPLLAVS